MKRHHFLTHASYPIYSTLLTTTLLFQLYPQLDESISVGIEVGQSLVIEDPDGDFVVTAFDANHGPGAVMFLFEGSFGNIFHTVMQLNLFHLFNNAPSKEIQFQIHGPVKWDKIATHIHGRTGKSCRIRWLNQLNPRVDKTPFGPEDKRRLVLLHRQFGNKWSIIASYFLGRTDNQVKNQYHILAGTWSKKAACSSSLNDPDLEIGFRGLSHYQSTSMAHVSSHFYDVNSRGTNNHGFAPLFSEIPGRAEMRHLLIDGSSSIYGKGANSTQFEAPSSTMSNHGPQPYHSISFESSKISNVNSVGIKCHQFIDFLGVGSSD